MPDNETAAASLQGLIDKVEWIKIERAPDCGEWFFASCGIEAGRLAVGVGASSKAVALADLREAWAEWHSKHLGDGA